MAKLSAYYTLCPLIDQQNLLGVEQDKESGWAIVTLGRNIVMRYKLQDLKQGRSWSSKEKLTSQVIYDKSNQRYAAAFKEKKIRVWSEEEVDLNNMKGYKFRFPLHTILTHDELPPVLVQQNGATASLEWAITNRKTWASKGILRTKEKLVHCQLIYLNKKTSLYCLTKIEETYNCLVVKLTDDTCLEKADTNKRIELKRESENLVGHTVIQNKNNAYLLTLWSHGRLYSHFLTGMSSDSETSTLISVITNINTKYPAVMTHLNESTIAVYGADVTDEGAILMIYNVQYKLAQAVQKLKLYTNNAKLWKVEDKLLLAANRHLAIAPYHLAPQRLAAMLGSSLHFKNYDDTDDVVVVQEATRTQWDKNLSHSGKSTSVDRLPTISQLPKITKQLTTYLTEGLSDTAIQEILIPSFIESGDVVSIYWCLDTFKDLPEKLLVDLLAFSLRSPDNMFVPLQNGTDEVSTDEISTSSDSNSYSRNDFLDKVFNITYSSTSLLPYLKTSLTLHEVLSLLEYLTNKLKEQTDLNGNPQPSEQQLYEWSNLLYISHHQHCIISKDARVLQVSNELSSVLEEHIQFLQDLEDLRPKLEMTINGKSLQSSSKKYNKFYCIEEIKLY